MKFGICRLCGQSKELVKSHLLSKGLYPGLNPVIMNQKVALKTDAQVKATLLCNDCEQLFSKNGEHWVLARVCDDRGNFPLLDRLRLAIPFEVGQRYEVYSCDTVGIDSEKLAYFALSVLWRASAQTWVFLGQAISTIDLGEHEETIRQYLLGLVGFPAGVMVNATVCTDEGSHKISFVPCAVENPPYTTFALLTRGLYFRILTGSNAIAALGHVCCVNGPRRPIFVASAEEKMLHAFRKLDSTAKPARNMTP